MSLLGSQASGSWVKVQTWMGSGCALACLWLIPDAAWAIAQPTVSPTPPVQQADAAETLSEQDPLPELESAPDRFLVPEMPPADPEVVDPEGEGEPETSPFAPLPPPNKPTDDPAAPPALPPPDSDYTAPLPPPNGPTLPPLQPGSGVPGPAQGDRIFGIPPAPNFDSYRLGPGDAVFVNVRRFPDLSFQATLDLQGNVIMPLQGVISLNGLTLQEAETLIAQTYDRYVVNPEVSMTLVAQRGVEVTILGEVVRPGFYPLSSPQISTALLSAGGTTGQADLRAISIQRRLPDGQLLEQQVDLFTPLLEGKQIPDVALQDGDVILVERLDPAALDEYDRDLVARSTLARPTIVVRLLNYGRGNLGGSTSGALEALELPNGSRFADALVRASLNPDTSDLSAIGLVRFDEEAGQALTTTLDGNEAFRGAPSQNPPLQHNDVIIVNRTLLAKLTYSLNTFTQPFRDVLGFLLFFDQLSQSAENLFAP